MPDRDKEAWPAQSDDDAEWRRLNSTKGREAEWESGGPRRPRFQVAPVRPASRDPNAPSPLPRASALDQLFHELTVRPDLRREFEVAPNRALKRVEVLTPREQQELQKVGEETFATLAGAARQFANAAKAQAVGMPEIPGAPSEIEQALQDLAGYRGEGRSAWAPESASGGSPDGLRSPKGGGPDLSWLDRIHDLGKGSAKQLPFELPYAKENYGGLSRGWVKGWLAREGIPLDASDDGSSTGASGNRGGVPGFGGRVSALLHDWDITLPKPPKPEPPGEPSPASTGGVLVFTKPVSKKELDAYNKKETEWNQHSDAYDKKVAAEVKKTAERWKDSPLLQVIKAALKLAAQQQADDEAKKKEEEKKKEQPPPPPPPPPKRPADNPDPDNPGGPIGPWVRLRSRTAFSGGEATPDPDDPHPGPLPFYSAMRSTGFRIAESSFKPNPDDGGPPLPWAAQSALLGRLLHLLKPNPDDPDSPGGPRAATNGAMRVSTDELTRLLAGQLRRSR